MSLNRLEERIGYFFRNRSLLETALTHTSYANEHRSTAKDYERLEFLGDAVLEMVSSACLYHTYPQKKEGEMSKLRASLVCEQALAVSAREIELEKFIRLGKGEIDGGGREKDSIISDVMEALIGAMFEDTGGKTEVPTAFIMRFILNDIEGKQSFYDAKSVLQEKAQEKGKEVRYRLVEESGPAHERYFTSEVYVGEKLCGTGSGRSKKVSEQQAAYVALSEKQDW